MNVAGAVSTMLPWLAAQVVVGMSELREILQMDFPCDNLMPDRRGYATSELPAPVLPISMLPMFIITSLTIVQERVLNLSILIYSRPTTIPVSVRDKGEFRSKTTACRSTTSDQAQALAIV